MSLKLRLFINIAIILFISSYLFLHKTNKIEVLILTDDNTSLCYQYHLVSYSFLPFFIQEKSFILKKNKQVKPTNNKELLFFLAKNNFSTPKNSYILIKHKLLIVVNISLLVLSVLYLVISLILGIINKVKRNKSKIKYTGYLK